MTDEFGVDLDEVIKVIEAADVLVVRFHLIDKRLLVDFRRNASTGPLVKIVPRAESVEDRFRSIKRLRPEYRVSAIGDDDTTEECGRVMEELVALERKEVFGAIRGADHYQTLWERQRA
jgi:hypothetical protein